MCWSFLLIPFASFSPTLLMPCPPTNPPLLCPPNARSASSACTRLDGPTFSSSTGRGRPRRSFNSSKSRGGQKVSTAISPRVSQYYSCKRSNKENWKREKYGKSKNCISPEVQCFLLRCTIRDHKVSICCSCQNKTDRLPGSSLENFFCYNFLFCNPSSQQFQSAQMRRKCLLSGFFCLPQKFFVPIFLSLFDESFWQGSSRTANVIKNFWRNLLLLLLSPWLFNVIALAMNRPI